MGCRWATIWVMLCLCCEPTLAAVQAGKPAAGVVNLPQTGSRTKIIVGEDDRKDYYELESTSAYAKLMKNSIVALIRPATLGEFDEGVGAYTGLSTRPDLNAFATSVGPDSTGMCTGQKFREQPTAAFCSGTLVGNRGVITAGHCVSTDQTAEVKNADCENIRIVFNYYVTGMDPNTGKPLFPFIDQDDVYSVSRCDFVQQSSSGIDWAYLELDRPVTSTRVPVQFQTAASLLDVGTPLAMIGFPSGLPAKLDDGASVSVSCGDNQESCPWFAANTDSFGGNSGSGIFVLDSARPGGVLMVGILVRGATDYIVEDSGCVVVNVVTEGDGHEQCVYSHDFSRSAIHTSLPSTVLPFPSPSPSPLSSVHKPPKGKEEWAAGGIGLIVVAALLFAAYKYVGSKSDEKPTPTPTPAAHTVADTSAPVHNKPTSLEERGEARSHKHHSKGNTVQRANVRVIHHRPPPEVQGGD